MRFPTSADAPTPAQRATREGVTFAVIAYTVWGVMPVYFKFVDEASSLEVLAHRVIWAVPFGALLIALRRQFVQVRRTFADRRLLAFTALAAAVIAINWLIFIYAVQSGQIFQASLGYYINPLVYVLAGVVLFGERLSALQLAAVAAAAVGVLVLTISGGEFPLIALSLAVSFTIYGVIRKKASVGALPALFVETLLLAPLAIAYLVWLMAAGRAAFGGHDPQFSGVLMLAGPLTVLPLLFFALSARRLPLSLVGFLQYIGPTLQFLLGVYFGETLTLAHQICFGLIWVAAALFIADALRRRESQRGLASRAGGPNLK